MSRRRARGFTLIELLVALTLLGLIALGLMGSLRFGARVWEKTAQQSSRQLELEATQRLLRRQVELLREPLFGQPLYARDHLRFAAPLPPQLGFGGSYLFDLTLEGQPGDMTLALAWRPEQRDAAPGGSRRLLSGLAGGRFLYLERDEEGKPLWVTTRSWRDQVPRLVAIELAFPAGDRREWPRLLIAPLAARP